MTAINSVADNRYAYIATDGAQYDVTTGLVVNHLGKTLMFDELRLAIAVTGRITPLHLMAAMDDVHGDQPATQASFLAAALVAFRQLIEDENQPEAIRLGNGGGALVAALYDAEARTPRILWAWTPHLPEHPEGAAYAWHETPGTIMPALTPAEEREAIPTGTITWPRRELARMLQMQRGKGIMGGPCFFCRVGPGGIDHDDLMAFPDPIGAPIDANRPGRFIRSKLDKRAR